MFNGWSPITKSKKKFIILTTQCLHEKQYFYVIQIIEHGISLATLVRTKIRDNSYYKIT